MREGPNGMETLARTGKPTPDDATHMFVNDDHHAQYATNGAGQIAFGDSLSLYITDESGTLRSVIVPAKYVGNQQVSPPTSAGERAVHITTLNDYRLSNGRDGRPRWFNDVGQFVNSVQLGGSSAVLVAQGPHIPGSPLNCNDTDFNNDGLYADAQDITDFIDAMGGAPAGTRVLDSIDFNNDGLFPDTLDIESFLSVVSGGPCLH